MSTAPGATVTKRPCATPGCPVLVRPGAYRGRCAGCNRVVDRDRGTPTERGYGARHRRLRAAIQARINSGQPIHCCHCGAVLRGTAWHLDHNDERTDYRGPACIKCNLSAAGKASHGISVEADMPPRGR